MKSTKNLRLFAVALLFLNAISLSAQNFTTLHAFDASGGTGNLDGATPSADLVLSGGTLYGTAPAGGTNGHGTIFSVNTSGAGFNVLYSFTGGADGALPSKHLVLSGDTLYGTAGRGTNGAGGGTIFSIGTNGTGFATLYTLNGGTDGQAPAPGLVLSGNTLYGTANEGGSGSRGTVFSVNTNGTGFTVLHPFTGVADGQNPNGGMVLAGGTLYSTARNGGMNGFGTLFSINTDGTGFTVLHAFAGHTNLDGAAPEGGLVLSGNTLYGTTLSGGPNGHGTVFSCNTNGTGYTVLYSFTGGVDGEDLEGGLVLSGNTLYGTSILNTNSGGGAVFALNTDGTSFTVLHTFSTADGSFGWTNLDGARPFGVLAVAENLLYGTTQLGGTNGNGTVFSLAILPSITGFNLAGTSVVLNGINGLQGHAYTVLTSANATSALNRWTPLVTNVLASGGNFTITATNAVNPAAPQQFYILQTQ